MKCTPSGHKWAHVSCVLWIPEVSIGCAEKMEPITKISAIPASRWSLVCVLCRERKGACIQCSVKTCKTAYHVTCAFKHGLEMRAIIEDENADDGVKLRSYCQKHSVNSKKDKCAGSGSEEEEVKKKRRKDMTTEEKNQARAARLQEIEREFDRHVSVKDISAHLLDVDQDAIYYIYNYWKLKRRAGVNRPLLPPKSDDSDILAHRQEQADLDKMKMFVQLRQDLERVRNLCYMVSRREKLSRSFFRMREQTFHKQVSVLSGESALPAPDLMAIIEANHGPSIYDRLYSHPNAADHKNNFDELLSRIAGSESGEDKKRDINGMVRGPNASNPYKKTYLNGSTRRSGSIYSGLSSEESTAETSQPILKPRNRSLGSSTDDGIKKKALLKCKKPLKTGKSRKPISKLLIESSSEDDKNDVSKNDKSKTLQQMEKEMTEGKGNDSGSESDELMTIRTMRKTKFPVDIYSDSSENEYIDKSGSKMSDKSSNATSDSLQQLPRTKAAMKEFVPSQSTPKAKRIQEKETQRNAKKLLSRKDKKVIESDEDKQIKEDKKIKEDTKSGRPKEITTDLIVPQRQAAKKAFENMRSTTCVVKSKDEPVVEKQTSGDEIKPKTKLKTKREVKDAKENISKGEEVKEAVIQDLEKETIAYVPQRQAAKKAAAHIKSGLGSKVPMIEQVDEKKKELEKPESVKKSPVKVDSAVLKQSSSSSSDSSSSSYSSASSSEIDEAKKLDTKPITKARDVKPEAKKAALFSPTGTRPTVDLPFLDRVSRPLSSTSASSDSDSSKNSRGSWSGSSIPKRPRRRRKRKTASNAAPESPPKAPDKKFKTSELGSLSGLSPQTVEREEPSRFHNESGSTGTRTRSSPSSRNMPNKSHTWQRKSSPEENVYPFRANETAKKGGQSCEFSSTEWKENQALNVNKHDTLRPNSPNDVKSKDETPSKELFNEPGKLPKQEEEPKESSARNQKSKLRITEGSTEGLKNELPTKDNDETIHSNLKLHENPILDNVGAITINEAGTNIGLHDRDRDWFPSAMSPHIQPPAIEKAGGHEKYMTGNKSLNMIDNDPAERSSLKMIAKIQANLNENTMIKSPKTPMDACVTLDSGLEPVDFGSNVSKDVNKHPVEASKKYNSLDYSQAQGIEISKSAKVPLAANPIPSRSIFSPQSKENEFYDIDMLAVDDSFNHDDIMRPFPPYPDPFFFKEDSKEQGVQETLNLVDRLRMQLCSKKVITENNENLGDEDRNSTLEKDNSPNSFQQSNRSLVIDLDARTPPKDTDSNHGALTIVKEDPPSDSQTQSSTFSDENVIGKPISRINIFGNLNTTEVESAQEQVDCGYNLKHSTQLKSINDTQTDCSIDSPHSNKESMSYREGYKNDNSLCHSIASPYINRDSSWGESKIATRRSSSSSSNSNESSYSQKTEANSNVSVTSQTKLYNTENNTYSSLPDYDCHMEPLPTLNQYDAYRPNMTLKMGSVSSLLEARPVLPGTVPCQTSEPGHMPQNLSLSYVRKPQSPPVSKSTFTPMSATFTSSTQNIALTTAMIAPPTPKALHSPQEQVHMTPSTNVSTGNETNSKSVKPANEHINDLASTLPTKYSQSPQRMKTATKLLATIKSPGKSPNFSPKQAESAKTNVKRQNKSSKCQRGKGRSKNRGQVHHAFLPHLDYSGNSIQSKLVGTVYDFEDEVNNDDVNLKSLRERRKSCDVHDRKSETSSKDNSQSPKAIHKVVPVPNTETKPPDSITEAESQPSSPNVTQAKLETTNFTPIVQTVLPGPVNMRTYQVTEKAAPDGEVYRNQLLAFASGATDTHLADIDEEVEKQLHSALMNTPKASESAEPEAVPPVVAPMPKVSLSDSRNQLKVKIKGPFLDANYSNSSTQPTVSRPVAPVESCINTNIVANTVNTSAVTGTTNLRRMRKKELLRQYWTQDMNMDDPSNTIGTGFVATPALPPPLSRAVITIPKAVASMTSIPTREDYKGLTDSYNIDKKKRKASGGLSRHLRNLEASVSEDDELVTNVRNTNYNAANPPRRGRVSSKPPSGSPLAPKLKIKIGSGVAQPVATNEVPNEYQFRPPKKRIVNMPKPNIEDLRRESMKYRRMVMADFEENESNKKHKPSKSEKRKKKKQKKAEKLQVVNTKSDSATKLIIKIKRPKEEMTKANAKGSKTTSSSDKKTSAKRAGAAPEATDVDPFEYDPSAPDPLAIDPPSYSESTSGLRKIRTAKVTPIRLKLSKSGQGSGYVMKGSEVDDAPAVVDVPRPGQSSISVNKHCDVR